MKNSLSLREQRRKRIRAVIKGTAAKPRLSVFRSHQGMQAQLINDETSSTIIGMSEKGIAAKEVKAECELERAKEKQAWQMGWLIAQAALAKGIKRAVFDRGGYMYHGRVKALADGARAGGLKF